MLKRVVLLIGVLGALSGWVGAGTLTAASAHKAYVGLFKDDAVDVIDTVQNKVLTTFSVPKGPHVDDTVEFFNLILGTRLTTDEKKDLAAFLRAL